jgi:5-deoxy-5-amino-3-dehydroquinate synthase
MTARGEHIVLIGTMGSGKTTIGRAIARLVDRALLDSDDYLQATSASSAREILERDGLDELHRLELEALAAHVSSSTPAVIVPAASTIDTATGRALIEGAGQVVYLDVDPRELARRVEGSDRPITGDVAGTLEHLKSEREHLYLETADAVVSVGQKNIEETTTAVLRALQRVVKVPLGERSYDVIVGPGARYFLKDVIPPHARRAALITQEGIDYPIETGIETHRLVIGDGEHAKSLATAEELCRAMSRAGITRNDIVIGLGGGVVTDVAGFVASIYHRGMPVVHVSSTLLGQVDAAIGGKTGVNLPEGKNLVGAFWQPSAVLCDTEMLKTLPARETRSGTGEMAKYAFLGVDDLDALPLPEQVASCVALKADVVASDEREGDRRMLLNYGHTLAHALEAAGFADGPGRDGIDFRHGEAVAIGLVFAARLAQVLGRIDETRVERHLEVVRAYGLPESIPDVVDEDELITLMGRDKKVLSGGLTFVLDGPNGVEVVRDVAEDAVREAIAACRASLSAGVRN